MSQRFEGKTALVTGGRSGIGFAIAKRLLQEGATVIITSRKAEPLQQAAKDLSVFGNCLWHACDIRESDQIAALVEYVRNSTGSIDVLVNNAGGQFPVLAEYLNDKGWNAVLNNNLNGTFYMTRDCANAFFIPQRNGTIVNITASVSRGAPGMVHTGAARAGVENMTKTLALEWSAFNIRVNCVAPGIIDSDGLKTYGEEIRKKMDEAAASIPMRRLGTPEDIAAAVCFLASEEAAYINGITLPVDGAQHLDFRQTGLSDLLRSYL
jgi:NAD(P)-dependent dehydrogenase (short-subunit alcohol dehydrogenase family)